MANKASVHSEHTRSDHELQNTFLKDEHEIKKLKSLGFFWRQEQSKEWHNTKEMLIS